MVKNKTDNGHIFIAVMVGITVTMIMLTAAIEPASAKIKRENEEDLIFRGEEYARAIRAYTNEHGGAWPTKLEDLIKPGPRKKRYIRKLYKNPMNRDGKWGLLSPFVQVQKPKPTEPGQPPQPQKPPLPVSKTGSEGQPIAGVYAKKHDKAFRTYMESEYYDEWLFSPLTLKETGIQQLGAGGRPPVPPPPPVSGK